MRTGWGRVHTGCATPCVSEQVTRRCVENANVAAAGTQGVTYPVWSGPEGVWRRPRGVLM